MNKVYFLSLFVVCFLFAGCTSNSSTGGKNDQSYAYTVEIEGVKYGFTEEQVPIEQIGKKIGVKPISCSFPECPAPHGDLFYEIKGTEGKDAIAVETYAGNLYYRCVRINKNP